MDDQRFDELTRKLAAGTTRRRLLGGLLGGALALLGPLGRERAAADHGCRHAGAACTRDRQCCSGDCRNGTCRCTASKQCPQPPTTEPCKKAVCTGTGRCAIVAKADGADCPTGICQGGACVECAGNADCPTGMCQNNACVCVPKGYGGCDAQADCCNDGQFSVSCSPSGVCGGQGASCGGMSACAGDLECPDGTCRLM